MKIKRRRQHSTVIRPHGCCRTRHNNKEQVANTPRTHRHTHCTKWKERQKIETKQNNEWTNMEMKKKKEKRITAKMNETLKSNEKRFNTNGIFDRRRPRCSLHMFDKRVFDRTVCNTLMRSYLMHTHAKCSPIQTQQATVGLMIGSTGAFTQGWSTPHFYSILFECGWLFTTNEQRASGCVSYGRRNKKKN